jgi:hypothetical protein
MKEECTELKNIKYKTMLLNNNNNNNSFKSNVHTNSEKINSLLKQETVLNEKMSWSKLDKTIKYVKIKEYILNLKEKHTLTQTEIEKTNAEMLIYLNKKKLYKVKDVDYNIDSGQIVNIQSLVFNKNTRRFTLKNDRRVSTLKSLAPKKRTSKTKTIKNSEKIDTI